MRLQIPKNKRIFLYSIALLFILGVSIAVYVFRAEASLYAWSHWGIAPEYAVAHNPDNGTLLFEVGQYYFNHGPHADGTYDIDTARQYFKKAASEDTAHENELLWYQLGRIDFLEGRFNTAIYKFNKQLDYFGEEVPNAHYMLGLTYGFKAKDTGREQDWQAAEESFKRYIELDPWAPWPKIDLAWVYFAQGKYEEMYELLEPEVLYYGENPWFNNMYGLALLNTGYSQQAQIRFKKALTAAEELTVEDWGKSYPGNHPASWASGLSQLRSAIRKNLELTNTQ